jgi:hypothetical protein
MYFNFIVKNNSANRKKTYNGDEKRMLNTDLDCICQKTLLVRSSYKTNNGDFEEEEKEEDICWC